MSKSYHNALSLMETIIVLSVVGILVLPTIDLMSNMVVSEARFTNNILSKQVKLNISDRISSHLREGSYIYPTGTSITIPTLDSDISVNIEDQSIAVLVPEFNSDGSVNFSEDTNQTKFNGIAYSVVSENSWNGSDSDKYVLVESTFSANITTDPDDRITFDANATAPTDWSTGSSYLLADNFMPATQDKMTAPFEIEDNVVTFGFVPGGNVTYFPSSSGPSVNDIPFISSVVVQNYR